MDTSALRLDQAPPLWVPASFFAVAPLAMVTLGVVLASAGVELVASPFLPTAVAATHLLTLGVLGAVMFGALYQMTPVVAGAPVPRVRLASVVLAALVFGCVGLVTGVAQAVPGAAGGAMASLGVAVAVFAVPVGIALARAPVGGPTVWGMRFALASLVGLTALGVWMARGYAGGGFAAARIPWMQLHATVALLGWVGCLIVAVSWQVVPMFYLAAPPPVTAQWTTLGAIVTGVLGATLVHAVPTATGSMWTPWLAGTALPIAAAPAVLAVGVLHPALVTRALNRRRRRRVDASLWFWRGAMLFAPLAVVAGVASVVGVRRASMVFAWLTLWGWGACLVHGMLTRIVPFLVWFHRFSALIGLQPVPSMRSMLPDRRVRLAFGLHTAATLSGAIGLGLGLGSAVRLAGVFVVATGSVLGFNLATVLRLRPESAADASSEDR